MRESAGQRPAFAAFTSCCAALTDACCANRSERCESARDPEAECFDVACELADAARSLPGVRGLHLISFRKEAGIARLCARLGIPTRHERETIGNGSRVAV